MMTKFSVADEKSGLGVPYPKGKHPGSNNVGYFDLKRNPERISDIHEIQGWPELEDFLKGINQSDSLFRTLRVDVAASSINHSGCTKKVTSFVTIAFEILEWNSVKETYQELYASFIEFATKYKTPTFAIVEFELVPTSYNDHGISRAWSVDIWNTGLGNSDDEARAAWYSGLKVVQDFLTNESSLYMDQLNRGRKTIS